MKPIYEKVAVRQMTYGPAGGNGPIVGYYFRLIRDDEPTTDDLLREHLQRCDSDQGDDQGGGGQTAPLEPSPVPPAPPTRAPVSIGGVPRALPKIVRP